MYRALSGVVIAAVATLSLSSVGNAQYGHLNRLTNRSNHGQLDLSSGQKDAVNSIIAAFRKQTRDADLKTMGMSPVDFEKVRGTPEEQEFVKRLNAAFTNKQLVKRRVEEHMRISQKLFDDLRKVLTVQQLEVLDRIAIEHFNPGRELFILIHNPRLQRLAELTDAQKKELERIYWSLYDHDPVDQQSEKAGELREKAADEFRRVLTPAQRKLLAERRLWARKK